MAKAKELKQEEITERWSYLIEGAEGRGEEIFKGVEKNLNKVQPPEVELNREMLTPEKTLLSMLRGQKREFLTASNRRLKGYKTYIGVKDYGKQLAVSWYLICEPGLIEKLLDFMSSHWLITLILLPVYLILAVFQQAVKKSVSPATMNLFDLEELTAYTTTVHHAVLESVADIMKGLKQDPSKIDRKSRGFLNIS